MSAEANAAAARRLTDEAFNHGRLEVFDEICAPDIVSHDPAEPGDVRGIEAHKERVRQYRAAISDIAVVFDDVIAVGDKVVTRWTSRGTNDGELLGMPPTGRTVEITGISIDRFAADGKLVETWDQWDNAGFAAQLGLLQEADVQRG
jgi:steroid delta-isomerase-like uncharacterized protein